MVERGTATARLQVEAHNAGEKGNKNSNKLVDAQAIGSFNAKKSESRTRGGSTQQEEKSRYRRKK